MPEKIMFETNLLKVRADGVTALSNYLEPGEHIKGNGLTYEQAKALHVDLSPAESRPQWKRDEQDVAPGHTTVSTDPTVTHMSPGRTPLARPSLADSKAKWYAYAVSKGFQGNSDDVTKQALIDQYGAQDF